MNKKQIREEVREELNKILESNKMIQVLSNMGYGEISIVFLRNYVLKINYDDVIDITHFNERDAKDILKKATREIDKIFRNTLDELNELGY